MKISKGSVNDKEKILDFLDAFRSYVLTLIKSSEVSVTAKNNGGELFDTYIESKDYIIFIAKRFEKQIN